MQTMKTLATIAFALLVTAGLSVAAGLPAINAQLDDQTTADEDAGDILIYDDYGGDHHPAEQAATNLQIAMETTADSCVLQQAAQEGAHNVIIVNSVWGILSSCDSEDIFPALTAYAEGTGNLLFQSWELDLCGTESGKDFDILCTEESLAALLGALGAQPPLEAFVDAPTLATSATALACSVGPNPILPAGLDTIEATADPAIVVAQGVEAADGITCLEDQNGGAQLVVNENGAYIGFAAPSYEGAADTTLPGPEDMVKLYENLITTSYA